MTSSLKRFRMQTFKDVGSAGDSDDPEEQTSKSIKKRHRRELEIAERENRDNTSALLELRDMEDELATLWRLFESQEATIKQMKALYQGKDLAALTHNGLMYLTEALTRLDEYKQQTTEMLKRVENTRKDVSSLCHWWRS
jgi:hypothetical protein